VLTEADIALLERFQVRVAHNPESNMKLASGVAPVPELLRTGICVGLGTDGCASNNDLDLFREMDTAAKLHKVHSGDPTVLNASAVLRMATIGGAKALGLDGVTGSLEPGKRADIIVIDTRKPHLTPMFDPVSHLVYAARGSDVAATIINGAVVMEQGRLPHLDLAGIMADVRRIARKLARK
jgi:5-methylthioadenosine/S-adenosylhomocysteine deaminase